MDWNVGSPYLRHTLVLSPHHSTSSSSSTAADARLCRDGLHNPQKPKLHEWGLYLELSNHTYLRSGCDQEVLSSVLSEGRTERLTYGVMRIVMLRFVVGT
ncbi:hypothetical protein PoB_007612100 [Plakobranchus ocellatus]|uniref:Uncharacterized protein n=1 Tax=Plakobranchus ocellatus TaxID=259542 RepID=A0AAV4E0I9_9GAST|nr:hypothetical protein PoB_007612100 [Plakobranchus ocellatus]